MFYDRNNLWLGLLIGLAMPIITFATLQVVLETIDTYGPLTILLASAIKARTLALMSLCINVFIMRWYQRRRHDESMRGVLIAIAICAIAWIAKYSGEVFA